MKQFFLVLALLFLAARPGAAGPLEEGLAAHENRDYAAALKHFLPLADEGDPDANYWLGIMHVNGTGVPQSRTRAEGFWRRAAEKWQALAEAGNAEAQYKLAGMYDYGHGVPGNQQEAGKWYRRSAEQGFAKAQWQLGQRYCTGRGGRRDETEADVWYQKARAQEYPHKSGTVCKRDHCAERHLRYAGKGFVEEQYELGLCYRHKEEFAKAEPWLKKAAEGGVIYARIQLALNYEELGNYGPAYFWATAFIRELGAEDMASRSHAPYLEKMRTRMAGHLSAEQRRQIELMADEWQPGGAPFWAWFPIEELEMFLFRALLYVFFGLMYILVPVLAFAFSWLFANRYRLWNRAQTRRELVRLLPKRGAALFLAVLLSVTVIQFLYRLSVCSSYEDPIPWAMFGKSPCPWISLQGAGILFGAMIGVSTVHALALWLWRGRKEPLLPLWGRWTLAWLAAMLVFYHWDRVRCLTAQCYI